MDQSILWGGFLRICQATVQAAPFLLTGLFVAAIFRRLLGEDKTRNLFGSGSMSSIVKAWLIGMLLPVCSLGVIPVVRQMKKSGISGGTILAFALAAPLFNPLSLMYGLTLSKPWTILVFSIMSLLVITVAGLFWDRIHRLPEIQDEQEPLMPKGLPRIISVGLHASRELAGPTLGLIFMGLLGVGILSFALPMGSLQNDMGHDNPMAPIIMTAVALPAYASPMTAMGQLGSMFQHGNSIGAAFILLTFGAGMNLGLIWWMIGNYGIKATGTWISLLLGVVLLLSYAIERPLYPADAEPANHTHAFDIYCQPFERGSTALAQSVKNKLKQDTQPFEIVSLEILAVILVSGIGLRIFDPHQKLETWLAKPRPDSSQSRWNIDVPGPVLGLTGLAMIVVISIVGCFAFYPEKNECMEELRLAKVEAFTAAISGNHTQVARWIPVCEDWLRRMQVGVYLREWSLSDYHRARAKVFQQWLELIEHEAEEGNQDEIRKLVSSADQTYMRLSRAFRTE